MSLGQAMLPSGPTGMRIIAPPPGSQLQPRLVVLDGVNAQMGFDSQLGAALADRLPAKKLVLRVISNVKVYWAKNSVASAASYHGILKAATGAADGTGGEVDLTNDQPIYVSLFASAACTVSVDVIYENTI